MDKYKKKLIVERSVIDFPVRQIVRDLVNIIKSEEIGTHYLPEEITDGNDFEYSFDKIPEFNIEFVFLIEYNMKDDYLIDATTVDDGFTIQIVLKINKEKYPKNMYDIIGDLNDIVAHEIEHIYQESSLRPYEEMDPYEDFPDERPNDKEYYKQPHEVPAELKGFRRVNKLRKEPIEKTIKDWFKRNQTIHQLNDEDIEELTLFLSQKYKEKYGKQ